MQRPLFLLSTFFLLTACASPKTFSTPQPFPLTPFVTSTSAPLQTPEGLVPLTTPLPTPTPFVYVVQSGDTLSQIAEKFNVSLDALQLANPEISANSMTVGQSLNIPSAAPNPSGEATPLPAPFTIQQIQCYPTVDQGMWCFVLAHNDSATILENLSTQITLVDSNNNILSTQTAFLPLDILPPNTSMPLAAFFAPPVPFNAKPQVQILTAIRLSANDARYIPAVANNTLVQVSDDGYSAKVTGVVQLQSQTSAAKKVWVVGTAYDEEGRVVGVRRWESVGEFLAGASIPFNFLVSSVGGRINSVDFVVEVHP